MKRFIVLLSMVLSVCASSVFAYTYVVDSYQYIPSLYGDESLLVIENGGTDGTMDLNDNSTAIVLGTSVYQDGYGGLEHLNLRDNSHLDFWGGELHMLTMNSDATAILRGGKITGIFSYQSAWKVVWVGPREWELVPNPHIEVICRGWDYDTLTKELTGTWNVDNNKDGLDIFNIQLVNVQGHSPAIENIKFTIIPEPATMLLLAAGGLLLKRR